MNRLLLFLLLLTQMNAWGQSLKGYSMGSVIGLGGMLKRLVIPNALPIGSLVGSAGHEVYDFSDYPEFKNRQAYCFQSIDFALDANIIGIQFGGEVSKVFTTGTCEMKPDALVGEDLVVFVSFDPGKGSKTLPLGIAFNFGFSMDNYVTQMKRSFSYPHLSNRKVSERLKRLHLHLAGYLAKKNLQIDLTPRERVFAKLLLFPFLSQYQKDKAVLDLIKLTEAELLMLRNISKKGYSFSLRDTLESFYQKARKDINFYYCKNYSDCEEIYVDFITFYTLLIDSFDDCGSINIYAGALSEFSIKATSKLKFEIGFGYARTEFNKEYNSVLPITLLAFTEFAGNNFVKKSKSCQELPKKVGNNFADFLSFMQ